MAKSYFAATGKLGPKIDVYERQPRGPARYLSSTCHHRLCRDARDSAAAHHGIPKARLFARFAEPCGRRI